MPTSSVQITGIERNTPNINAKPGSCEEIINMRFKNNAWRPVNLKSVKYGPITAGLDYDIIYRHPVLADNEFIGYNPTDDKVYKFSLSGSIETTTELLDIGAASEVFLNISHLGNILIIATTSKKYYFRYNNDSDTYLQLEEIPFPLIDKRGSSYTGSTTTDAGSDFTEAKILYNLLYNNIKAKGYVNGLVYIRFAYRLFDGSYIKYSQIYTSVSISSGVIYDTSTLKFSSIYGSSRGFRYKFSTAQKNILEDYEGLIDSLCVFFSEPSEALNIDTDFGDYILRSGTQHEPPLNNLENSFKNTSSFYLVHEFPLKEIIENPEITTTFNPNPNYNIITTFETLPINDFTNHEYVGNYNYGYNSRLHLANVTTILSKSYKLWLYLTQDDLTTGPFIIEAYLNTDQGEKIIKHEIGDITYWSVASYFYLDGIVCYPDTRCYRLKLIEDEEDGSYNLMAQYDLQPHPVLNLAFYSNPYAYTDAYGNSTTYPADIIFSYPDSIVSDYNLATEDKTIQDTNRLQVSELDNPFYYPTLKSYRISDPETTIIGVSSVAEIISQGQFGQYPLYAFTTDGIYTLEQGIGSVLYASIVPVSREVCNNANSIVSFNGGIFFSTDNGLYIIAGNAIQEISDTIEGVPDNYVESNPHFQRYTDKSNLVELYDNLSSINFLTFLESAILSYDYINSEIIISNPTLTSAESSFSYDYSYVYNIKYNTWHKITQTFSQFINNYPEALAYDDITDTIYNITEEDSDDYISCLIQTRPLNLGTQTLKKIRRMFLRGNFENKEKKSIGVYIFSSNNGRDWLLQSGKQNSKSEFFDVETSSCLTSSKYFVVLFTGQIKNSQITQIDIEFQEKWTRKLR